MSDTEHIVIVDDEADVRDTIGEYLGNQGFRITALESGAELRQLVESEDPFELALLDISMPGEDGLSLARFLRERVDVGIVMVTASGEPWEGGDRPRVHINTDRSIRSFVRRLDNRRSVSK